SQFPDISNVFLISMDSADYYSYSSILFSIFAVVDSLGFAGAVFVSVELWLGIKSASLLFLPSDLRPYVIGLLVGVIVLLSHILFLRLTLFKYAKMLQEKQVKAMAV